MNRRSLLRGLLSLPVLSLAKLLPMSTTEWLVNWKPTRGSDQASITLLDWVRQQQSDKMEALLPVIESLNRQNPFLQDAVWKEGSMQVGHRISYSGRLNLSQVNWLKRSINGN